MDSASLSGEPGFEVLQLVGLEVLGLEGLKVLDVWRCADVTMEQMTGSSAVRCVSGWDEALGLRGEGVSGWGEVVHWLCWLWLSGNMFDLPSVLVPVSLAWCCTIAIADALVFREWFIGTSMSGGLVVI